MNEPYTRSGSPRTRHSIGRAVRRRRRVCSARHTGTWLEARCHHPVIPTWTVPTRSDATTAASTHKTSTSQQSLGFWLTFYSPHIFSICTLLLAEKSQPTDMCQDTVWFLCDRSSAIALMRALVMTYLLCYGALEIVCVLLLLLLPGSRLCQYLPRPRSAQGPTFVSTMDYLYFYPFYSSRCALKVHKSTKQFYFLFSYYSGILLLLLIWQTHSTVPV